LYDHGTGVQLTASAGTGYVFGAWSGDATGTTNPLTVTMSQPYTETATFAINLYGITASAGANGAISPTGVTQVAHGGSRTYTITPAAHYHVAGVLVDGGSVGATNHS
jgi:uncharacterized repeat protein (TIGR02543 family)